MPKHSKPRAGSLQFWPRKRGKKFLPRVNWSAIDSNFKLLGFIGYKVGMASCLVKDITEKSMTKDKRIIIPCTIIESPSLKIFSVRFYKNNQLVSEVLSENLDKELKRKLKVPKRKPKKLEDIKDEEYDNIRVIVYSNVKSTGVKKTPDLVELGLGGGREEKLNFVKEKQGKEIFASEVLKESKLLDVRGLTKGKGIQGPVKRFGIRLKDHKSEKGVRRPGNIGPWHPAHVSFRAPMAGQLGMFTRVNYNSKIINIGKITEKNINPDSGFKNYGKIKTEYIILQGSVQGPSKRALLLTLPLRATKKQEKLNYGFVELR